jgi:hypothetical protein
MKPALVISDRDNVATALEPLEPGRVLEIGGVSVATIEPIASGHKVALRAIRAGQAVIKYGSPIGVATADIAAGAHVHTHNLASTRGRGDLDSAAQPTEARLAEPPDDPSGEPAGTSGVPPTIAAAARQHEGERRMPGERGPAGGLRAATHD